MLWLAGPSFSPPATGHWIPPHHPSLIPVLTADSDAARFCLACSLPNEVDWAYKMLLVLAYEGLDVSKVRCSAVTAATSLLTRELVVAGKVTVDGDSR